MCILRQIILLGLHKFFMNRSLLQPSPSKKGNDNSNAIRDARSGSFRSTMSSFTEVMIETNDLDVPFISIFKPDIKKEQRRVQAVTSIDKCVKKMELFRINFAFWKLAATKVEEKNLKDKVARFEQLFAKMAKKRVVGTFWKIATNKSRKKSIEIASKILNRFQTSKRRSNIREGMNRLKLNSLQTQVRTLHDESQLSRELTLVKNELFLLKQQAFSQQFLEASKNQIRLTDNQTYVDNLRQNNYRQTLIQQLSRFQQIRTKRVPKKKDLLVPQQIITVLNNMVKAYQGIIAGHPSYQQELRQQLEGYTNTEGISQMTEQIRQRDSIISQIDSFLNDISKMDAEMKRFTGERLNSEKIMSLISQHQKRLEIKVKKMEGIVPKINTSRMFLNSIICSALKRWGEDKQSWGKQLEQLAKIGNEEDNLKVFIQRIREKTSLKVLAQLLYGFHQKIATLQENHNSRLSVLQLDASSAKDLKKQVTDLNIKIAELTRKLDLEKASISNLLSFIQENQSRIASNKQIRQQPAQKIDPHLEPILTSIVNIIKNNKALQDKNFEFQRQIHLLEQRESNHLYSETKIIKQVQNQPAWKLIDVRDSEISLAQRFLQPLNQLIEGRKEDLQLKHQLINIQGKIQEIISHNVKLQQELLKLQEQVIKLEVNDKAMREISARNAQLKQENERLKAYEQKYYELLKVNQRKQQIKEKMETPGTSNNQYRIQELSFATSSMRDQQISSLEFTMREQEEVIVSLKQERERFVYQARNWQSKFSTSEQTVIRQRHQLQEKQTIISSLLEQSRTLSSSFNTQLLQLRQEYAAREQTLTDRLAEKDTKIQRLQLQVAQKRMSQNISVSDIPQQNISQMILLSKISDYQYRIRQLTLINAELSQKVASLKESHSQFSSIASSNLQLSEKINEIYRKSTSQPLLQSNEQQLMKQTEMMKQILTLKLEAENQAMNHLRDISALRSQINSYQTIISKLENDLMQKDSYILQQEGIVKSLQYKYKEEKEVNEQLKVKIDKFEHVVSIETTTRFKEGEAELNRLKDQCYRIYEQLQKSIENLTMRDKQVISLETNMREQEELIMSLKQERERLVYQSRSWESKFSSSEETVTRQRHELTQVRSQLQSTQIELHRLEFTQSHSTQSAQVFQGQLQEKQAIIASLLEQSRALSVSFNAQLQQLRQEHAVREQALTDKLADKDSKVQRLEIEIAQKMSTITSLQHLISLYSNGEQDGHAPRHPFSRDKEIQYLNEQIKSLQEFLEDINIQYRQLETKYQQQRQKFHHSQIFSPQKHKDFKKSSGFLSQRRNNKRENESYQSIKFQQSYKEEQLNRDMKSTESLSYSTEIRQGEGTDLFLRMRNSQSIGLAIELIYNVLLNVAKLSSSSNEGQKIWRDICDMRTLHSGEALFLNLQGYCRQFIASCSRNDR